MLLIRQNESLENLNGLEHLKGIGKDDYFTNVLINWNPKLQNINGFQGLTTIGGPNSQNDFNAPSLWVYGNDSLMHIDGLSSLNFVKGYIKFLDVDDQIGPNGPGAYGNASLTDYCGLQYLLEQGRYGAFFNAHSNYNSFAPDVEDIIAGNCSQ